MTYYTVPFQLAQRLVILPSALSLALFPRMSAANGPEGRRLAMRALQSLTVDVMPMTVAGVVLIGPFLRLWIGQEFSAIASTPAQILLVAFSMNGLALVPFINLQARSRPDFIAKCHLAELVPYLIILVAAARCWGRRRCFRLRAAHDRGLRFAPVVSGVVVDEYRDVEGSGPVVDLRILCSLGT